MPKVRVNDIQLYYEVHGQGEPLLLIMGLGANARSWQMQIPFFSREFQVVAFDNRGAGRSDKPAERYTIRLFADDTAGLMDALGIDSAHVYGQSMGGLIAQELALNYPERVRTLVLGSTTCGGREGAAALPEHIALMAALPSLSPLEAAERGLPLLYSDEFIARKREELIARALAEAELRTPPDAFGRQAQAAIRYRSYDRLPQIHCPTLVISGSEDKIVPAENSRILAERIPNAELVLLPKAGHGYLVECAEESNAIVLDFLRRHRSALPN
ncbi:MAG: alpha/beta fold hydrolase [Dehalococcoidia bacterium]